MRANYGTLFIQLCPAAFHTKTIDHWAFGRGWARKVERDSTNTRIWYKQMILYNEALSQTQRHLWKNLHAHNQLFLEIRLDWTLWSWSLMVGMKSTQMKICSTLAKPWASWTLRENWERKLERDSTNTKLTTKLVLDYL